MINVVRFIHSFILRHAPQGGFSFSDACAGGELRFKIAPEKVHAVG
jgi:hypothetical protein